MNEIPHFKIQKFKQLTNLSKSLDSAPSSKTKPFPNRNNIVYLHQSPARVLKCTCCWTEPFFSGTGVRFSWPTSFILIFYSEIQKYKGLPFHSFTIPLFQSSYPYIQPDKYFFFPISNKYWPGLCGLGMDVQRAVTTDANRADSGCS